MDRRDTEAKEFDAFTESNEMLAGYEAHEINSQLPDSWDESKRKRFIVWFLLKGIIEGWIYSEYGM